MNTWLLEGALSFLLFAALVPVLIAPFLGAVYRRYRYPAPGPTLLAAAAGLYACALVAFTTFPLPEAADDFCDARRLDEYWHLVPGNSTRPFLELLSDAGPATALTSTTFLQIAFNVLFFVPLGFLIAYALSRGIGTALLAGFGVSLLIESTQGTGLWGLYPCPYRLADVDDLIANTSGAALGWALGRLIARWIPFVEPPRRTDTEPPTLRRRVLAAALDCTVLLVIVVSAEVAVLSVGQTRGWDLSETGGIQIAVQVAVGAILLLLVPMLRADRATPGQIAVLLTTTAAARGGPAGRPAILVRFAVRWLPFLILGWPVLLVTALVELATAALRSDRRSLAGLLAATRTMTVDESRALGAAAAAEAEPSR